MYLMLNPGNHSNSNPFEARSIFQNFSKFSVLNPNDCYHSQEIAIQLISILRFVLSSKMCRLKKDYLGRFIIFFSFDCLTASVNVLVSMLQNLFIVVACSASVRSTTFGNLFAHLTLCARIRSIVWNVEFRLWSEYFYWLSWYINFC